MIDYAQSKTATFVEHLFLFVNVEIIIKYMNMIISITISYRKQMLLLDILKKK